MTAHRRPTLLRPVLLPTSAVALGALLAGTASGQGIPYATGASWESYPGGVATGGALADIDGDGHLDVIVANGNDIQRQRVDVFTNDGSGNFPTNPSWSSADIDYHGHVAVGDVDQDGYVDVAVAAFLGSGGFGSKGRAKLYYNQSGVLETSPSWTSSDRFFGFSCDLGDADSDGDLDLAVATGEPYFDPPDQDRIYYNSGGVLATTPGWLSAATDHALDVAFGDADGDGDLDLAFAPTGGPAEVYYQGPGGVMATTPAWQATDSSAMFGNTCTWGDVDGDGFLELAVSDNDQLSGGAGIFKVYDNAGGTLAKTPFWTDFGGEVSGMALADLDGDGLPELAGGVWFAGNRIYPNQGGTFPTVQAWDSTEKNTVETLVFGDVDEDGLQTSLGEAHAPNGGRTYYVQHRPVQSIDRVVVDGVELLPSQYSWDREDGWIALDRTPAASVDVDYVWSDSLDLLSTSWDTSIGSLIFLRYPVARATFRNDAGGSDPAGYLATAPRIGGTFSATLDTALTGNTLGGIVGFATGAELPLSVGVLLVNVLDPGGELLALPPAVGTGTLPFSIPVPTDLALLGFSLATQGYGYGGPGVRLFNAYDLVVGG